MDPVEERFFLLLGLLAELALLGPDWDPAFKAAREPVEIDKARALPFTAEAIATMDSAVL